MTGDIAEGIAGIVGARGVLTGEDTGRYLEDWWGRQRGDAACVVLPASTDEVSRVVAFCHRGGISITPQGGNTSVCYGATPPVGGAGIVLGLHRMNAVLDVNARDNSKVVQAGCLLADAQAAAASVDRLFPLSLGAEGSCQIGGNIATNAGGTGVLRYGNMRDLVLGLDVVLADGRVWNGLRTLRKNNSGYDLKNLFIGAEGTLGIVTAAALKLFPRQPEVVTALLALPGIDAAVSLGLDLGAAFAAELSALEILSASQLRLVAANVPAAFCPLALDLPWYLLVELASAAPAALLAERLGQALAGRIDSGAVGETVIAMNEGQRAALWRVRHSVTEANKKQGMGFSYDIAVPIAAVPAFIADAARMVTRDFPAAEIVVVGHLGDGNLHYILMFDHATWAAIPDQQKLRRDANRAIYDLAAFHRGTFSAEHGIGAFHLEEMARYKDPVELELMRGAKAWLDPAGIMNPGRVLPPA